MMEHIQKTKRPVGRPKINTEADIKRRQTSFRDLRIRLKMSNRELGEVLGQNYTTISAYPVRLVPTESSLQKMAEALVAKKNQKVISIVDDLEAAIVSAETAKNILKEISNAP